MQKQIRIAIMGTNVISDQFVEAARKVPNAKVVAVYSRQEITGRSFANKHNISFVFTDLISLATSSEFDTVYIATPNGLHAKHCLIMLEHGKHVLCEKPFTSTVDELIEVVKLAKSKNLFLMEMFKPALNPMFQVVKENLPKIGKILRFVGSFNRQSDRYWQYKNDPSIVPNVFNPALNGGSIVDIGVYPLGVALHLFGMPSNCLSYSQLLDTNLADALFSSILIYPDFHAIISASKINTSMLVSEIQGELGSIIIPSVSEFNKATLQLNKQEPVELHAKNQENSSMQSEIIHAADLILAGKTESNVNTFEFSINLVKLMTLIKHG